MRGSATVSGERMLIARLASQLGGAGPGVPLGLGDDAAVVEVDGTPVVLAVDVLVEGVHWRPDVSSPGDVGWKALAVNVSDLAAVGADPVAAVVGLQRPSGLVDADVEAIYAGLAEAATRWGVPVVGGDVVDADLLALSVTVVGSLAGRQAVSRAGAGPGDALVCVGGLGAAAAALALLARGLEPDGELLAAHRRPQPWPAAGRALAAAGATAMIDVSDGLGVDAAHLARASEVRARVEAARLPVADSVAAAADALGVDAWELVTGGGEDFALLAAVPAARAEEAADVAARAAGAPAAVIGELAAAGDPARPWVQLDVDGELRDITDLGFEHGR